MSNRQVIIAIDAMGGEDSPYKVLKGTEIFLKKNKKNKIVFFGNEDLINQTIKKNNLDIFNHEIINTDDIISDGDNVNTILRSKKNSSIYKGLEYSKNNQNSGFVSSGSTAAIMVLSRLHMGMIPGIDRPAICSLVPTQKNYALMLDLGANVNVSASNLFQFALMGFCYYSIINKDTKPKIGILNIGTENNKGLEFLQEAADLVLASFLKDYFIGFIEPNKITSGNCDIIISDGYTGNIMLKSSEGIANFITSNLKDIFNKSLINKISYKLIEKDLSILKNQVNPDVYNGATLIGLNGISVKSHGNANPLAFSYALNQCHNFIVNNLNMQIIKSIKNI
ncbi:phosphate acyltransferase PlsX [bacterium]|nr:phosphate acyltransferase PlsX [bacterium]